MTRMPDVEILRLEMLDPELLRRIGSGYSSGSKYQVAVQSDDSVVFTIEPVHLETPHRRTWEYPDSQIQEYSRIVSEGLSFAVRVDREVIALAICSPRRWNNTLWVEEFHVAEQYRRMGIGRRLMERVVDQARTSGFRSIGLEAQNTNMPALQFYFGLGFKIVGLDVAFYSNEDLAPDGEVALFLARPL